MDIISPLVIARQHGQELRATATARRLSGRRSRRARPARRPARSPVLRRTDTIEACCLPVRA